MHADNADGITMKLYNSYTAGKRDHTRERK